MMDDDFIKLLLPVYDKDGRPAVFFYPGDLAQFGGFSSPASQPVASVFKGSTAKQTFSMRWQVLHSKVRSS